MPVSADALLWKDKKRYFGMPISFTTYSVSDDRLFRETGFLNRKYVRSCSTVSVISP